MAVVGGFSRGMLMAIHPAAAPPEEGGRGERSFVRTRRTTCGDPAVGTDISSVVGGGGGPAKELSLCFRA